MRANPPADREPLDRGLRGRDARGARALPATISTAATLFADAMMNLRPWDLWSRDGTPQPGTEELVADARAGAGPQPQPPGRQPPLHPRRRGLARPRRAPRPPPIACAARSCRAPATWSTCRRTSTCGSAATPTPRESTSTPSRPTGPTSQRREPAIYRMMYYPHNIDFIWHDGRDGGPRRATTLRRRGSSRRRCPAR